MTVVRGHGCIAGVSRRAIKALLRICKARTAIDYTIRASLMEIYNDKIIDLLSDIPPDEQKVDLRMDPTTKTAQVFCIELYATLYGNGT